jgi:hypothetical protein
MQKHKRNQNNMTQIVVDNLNIDPGTQYNVILNGILFHAISPPDCFDNEDISETIEWYTKVKYSYVIFLYIKNAIQKIITIFAFGEKNL